MKQLEKATDNYFKEKTLALNSRPPPERSFLKTPEGEEFVAVFRSVHILESELIIPLLWLVSSYRAQRRSMLHDSEGKDIGPDRVTKSFRDASVRCGWVVQKEGNYRWRLTEFSFGVDLFVSYKNRSIFVKWSALHNAVHGPVSIPQKY